MELTMNKIKTLFRLLLVAPSNEITAIIITELKDFYQKNGHISSDQFFIEFFSTLLPVFAANKKSFHSMFESHVEIGCQLVLTVKIESVDLFLRITKIICSLLVDMDDEGNLKVIKQNDTIKIHILTLLNNLIIENKQLFRMLLENHKMLNFYGYLCAMIKTIVHQSSSTNLHKKCINIYKIAPNFLVESHESSFSLHKKISQSILSFLPGILATLVNIFKNKSHLKNELKIITMEAFYLYLGVLLDDRWCRIDYIGHILNKPLDKNSHECTTVQKNSDSYRCLESRQKLSSLLKEITNLVFLENMNKLYQKLADIAIYMFNGCKNLNFSSVLLDIFTKLMIADVEKSVNDSILHCLKIYSSFCENNRTLLIDYYNNLCKTSIDNILKYELNFIECLKLLNVCLMVCGNFLCLEYITLKKLVIHIAIIIQKGNTTHALSKEIKLYSSDSLPYEMKQLTQISTNKNQYNNLRNTLTEAESDVLNKLLNLLVYCGKFIEISSLCLEIMSDCDENDTFVYKWPYLQIIVISMKAYHHSNCEHENLFVMFNKDTKAECNIDTIIESVHDCIFGDRQLLFRHFYGGQYFLSHYITILQELGIILNLDQLESCHSQFYEHHSIQMCINIFHFVEESSYILSYSYVTNYLIQNIYPLLMMRCTMARHLELQKLSYESLNNISHHVGFDSLKGLVIEFKEVIIDEISLEMRYLSWNNKAPIIFKSLINIMDHDRPCFLQIIDPLVDIFVSVVERYHDEGFLFSYIAFDAYAEFMLCYIQTNSPNSDEFNHPATDNSMNSRLSYHQSFYQLYPEMNDSESISDFFKNYYLTHEKSFQDMQNDFNHNSSPGINQESGDNDDNLQKCPIHLKRIQKIMSLCVHFLNSQSQTLQIMVHQLCCKCIMAFDKMELVIYPLMHKLWDPLLYSIKTNIKNNHIKRSLTLAGSINLLGVMCEFSGNFLKARVIDQFIPIIQHLYSNMDFNPCNLESIKNICSISGENNCSRYYDYRKNSDFEIALMKLIPKIVDYFYLKGPILNFLVYSCTKFIQGKFSQSVKQEAVRALHKLITVEPYVKDLINTIDNRLKWDNLCQQYQLKINL